MDLDRRGAKDKFLVGKVGGGRSEQRRWRWWRRWSEKRWEWKMPLLIVAISRGVIQKLQTEKRKWVNEKWS